MSNPIEIDPYDISGIKSSGSVQVRPHGSIEAGTLVPGPDGRRYLFTTVAEDVIFIQTTCPNNPARVGKFFRQSRSGFASDVGLGAAAGEVFKKTAATKEVIKDFMDIFIAAVSCAGGPVGMAITGFDKMVKVGKIYRIYEDHRAGFEAILTHKGAIKLHMPTFNRTVFDQFVLAPIKDHMTGKARKIAQGIILDQFKLKTQRQKEVAGNMIGVFVGKVGKNHLEARFKAINTLLEKVLIKVAKHVVDTGESLDYETQIEKLARIHVKGSLQTLGGGNIAQHTAEEIIRETAKNARLVQKPLKDIAASLRIWGTNKYGDY